MLLASPQEVETHGIESTNFTVNFNAKAYSIFSDKLYSDKNGSAAREYLTNAYDSHRSANKADIPIQVTLPTSLDPNYIVQDYGIGMTREEATRAFSGMFDSTKDKSETDIGGYGLGSKSAFAITTSFSATCVKDGMCTQLLMFKSSDGIPQIAEAFYGPTNDVDGVRISIPIAANNIGEFCQSAKKQMYGIYPKPECNLEFNSLFDEGVIKYENDLMYLVEPEYRYSGSYVCIRNGVTLYPIPNDKMIQFDNSHLRQYNIILKSEINSVDVPPSRETLEYTTKTKSFLNQQYHVIIDFINNELVSTIENSKHLKSFSTYKEINKSKDLLGFKIFGDNFLYRTCRVHVSPNPIVRKFQKSLEKELAILTRHLKLVLFANHNFHQSYLEKLMWDLVEKDVIVCSDKPVKEVIKAHTASMQRYLKVLQDKDLTSAVSTILFRTTKKNGIKEYQEYRLKQIKNAQAFVDRFLGENILTLMPLSVLKSMLDKPTIKKERKEPTSIRIEVYSAEKKRKISQLVFLGKDLSNSNTYWVDESSNHNVEYLLRNIATLGRIDVLVVATSKQLKMVKDSKVRPLIQWIEEQHACMKSDLFAGYVLKTKFCKTIYSYGLDEVKRNTSDLVRAKFITSLIDLIKVYVSSGNGYAKCDGLFSLATTISKSDEDNIFGFENPQTKEYVFGDIRFNIKDIHTLNDYCGLLESINDLSNSHLLSTMTKKNLEEASNQIILEMDQLLGKQ